MPPAGWCSRKRVLGRQRRFSFLAPRKMCAPALATQPVPITFTSTPQKRIMSWMVSPLSTWPPGELMIIRIGLSLSAAKAVIWAVTRSASRMSISPNISTVRDLKSAFWTGPAVIGMSGWRPLSSSSPSSSSQAVHFVMGSPKASAAGQARVAPGPQLEMLP